MKSKIKKGILALAAAALAIWTVTIVHPGIALAQMIDEPQRAREELSRTDELISTAQRAIAETKSEKAHLVLNSAVEIQTRAWNSYRGNSYRMAIRLTLEAREQAQRAISLARGDSRIEENLPGILDETRDRLAAVRDMTIENNIKDAQLEKLMEEAQRMMDKSRLNMQQNRYQLALGLAMNARRLAERSHERARNAIALKETAERRLALMERLLERARLRVREMEREKLRAELEAASRKIEQARELIATGRYREANRICERCERSLRAIVQEMPQERPADPRVRLEETKALLERARDAVASGEIQDKKSVEAIERARTMLEKAENALASGREEESLGLTTRARETLREAIRNEGEPFAQERIETRLANMERIRDQAHNIARSCPEPGIKGLLERADGHLELARNHARSSNFESAAAEAAIARNIYRRVMDLCAR